jgi:hypothetical protein
MTRNEPQEPPRPVSEMSGSEFRAAYLDQLTRTDLQTLLIYLAGLDPDGMTEALSYFAIMAAMPPYPCGNVAPATGRECILPAGHPGQHQSGMVVWGPGVTEAEGEQP